MALNFLCRHSLLARSARSFRTWPAMASGGVYDVVADDEEDLLRKNPYFRKYETKIGQLRKENPEDYLARLKSENRRRAQPRAKEEAPLNKVSQKLDKVRVTRSPLMAHRSLSDIVKLELLETKTSSEIEHIWREFHKNVDGLSAVVPGYIFRTIQSRSRMYPIFLLPLPRKEGYEFIVCQFDKNEVHFTQLISWQTHKENAPVCMSLVYYPELLDSKEITLMRGSYDKTVLSLLESQCLANSLSLYYGEDNSRRTELLDRFTHDPDNFKHMDLIAEVEMLNINSK